MYNRRGQLIRRSRKTRSFYETFWYQKQNMTIANSSTYESSIRHNCKSEFATSQVSCCVWLSVSHFYTWCSAFLWILVKAFIISCLGDFFWAQWFTAGGRFGSPDDSLGQGVSHLMNVRHLAESARILRGRIVSLLQPQMRVGLGHGIPSLCLDADDLDMSRKKLIWN